MSTLTNWNPFRAVTTDPFREFRDIENRLARFFDQSLPAGDGGTQSMTVTQWAPLVDISEDDKEYLVKAELPELKKEDVKVTVEDGELSISGERKMEKEEKGKKYHRVERSYGSFQRTFTLPEGVNGEKVSAEFADGVLKVHLPKDEKAKPKALEVTVK